jgi:hypothetical protein
VICSFRQQKAFFWEHIRLAVYAHRAIPAQGESRADSEKRQ